MLSSLLPRAVIAPLAFVALTLSPVIGFLCLIPFAALKLIAPFHSWRLALGRATVAGANMWLHVNRLAFRLLHPYRWHVDVPQGLSPDKSYLLISNHQSWIDILLLGDVFFGKTPFPRFFLKQELIWVPVIGIGCWAMDMPFMKRHSKADIKKNPALKGQDLETTRKFCERFKEIPVTVVNFVEGTRFTNAKCEAHGSPFRYLLRPKSAGLRVALESMGEQFDGILDVTISYPVRKEPILWRFLGGEQDELSVHAELLPVPKELLSTSKGDEAASRGRIQTWVNERWAAKDERLARRAAA